MTEQDVSKKITEIFQDTFPELKGERDEFDMEKKYEDFESWDSFAHMELVGKVEEVFSITLDIDEIVGLNTPRKFVQLVFDKKRA